MASAPLATFMAPTQKKLPPSDPSVNNRLVDGDFPKYQPLRAIISTAPLHHRNKFEIELKFVQTQMTQKQMRREKWQCACVVQTKQVRLNTGGKGESDKFRRKKEEIMRTFRTLQKQQRERYSMVARDLRNTRLYLAEVKLAPRGAWLRQKSCQEISCSRSVGIKEVSFV
jgi:hypothetical protein